MHKLKQGVVIEMFRTLRIQAHLFFITCFFVFSTFFVFFKFGVFHECVNEKRGLFV
jgi:hypothetical protein